MRFFVAVFAVVSFASCGRYDCRDCGPCGLQGGPNVVNTLTAYPGADQNQDLQVALHAGAPKECGAPNVSWLDVKGTVTRKPVFEALAHDDVTQAPSESKTSVFEWKGRTITLDHTQGASALGVTITFPDGTTLSRICATADGKTVTCT